MKVCVFYIVSLILFLLIGCRADETVLPAPQITVLEPQGSRHFEYLDTVFVKAHIHHYHDIDYIRLAVVNEESTPVLPVQMFYPGVKEFNLETFFIFDNLLTASGNFSVNVRVGSASGVTNEWVNISYTSAPEIFEALIVITQNLSSGYAVNSISAAGILSEKILLNGDYKGSAVSSKHQMLFKAGSLLSNLDGWDLRKNTLKWSVPAVVNPPLPYFTAIYSDNNEVFCGTRDAFIYGYSAEGLNTFRSKQFSNGYFTSLLRYNSWLIAVFEPFNFTFRKLVVFNYPGGTIFRELEVPGEIVSMADYGKEGLLVFVNEQSGSAVYNFSVELNAMIKLKDFPQGNIIRATISDINNIFFAIADGIYWYRPANASMVKYLSQGNVADISFEPVTGKLFVASGNQVHLYLLPDTEPVETFLFNGDIVNIHPLYNK